MRIYNTKKGGGFTLIELLVVIVIIGILASIGVSTFFGFREKARDSERLATVNQMEKAALLSVIERKSKGLNGLPFGGDSDGLLDFFRTLGVTPPAYSGGHCYVYAFIDTHEFIFLTLGETTSTENSNSAGTIYVATPGLKKFFENYGYAPSIDIFKQNSCEDIGDDMDDLIGDYLLFLGIDPDFFILFGMYENPTDTVPTFGEI